MQISYIHFNRLVKKYDLDAFVISGPGHGAPGLISNFYLEGVYSEVYPNKSEDVEGMQRFFKQFSFPGGIGSHMTPETPGSIHEGGELGYSLSHAFGTVFDHPNTIALTIVGDGESETGPLATSWHSNKFLNPITDGAVLPILHLNGYKINNPTILARISEEELRSLMIGYGWKPYFVEGFDLETMHQAMAGTLETCVQEILKYQKEARESGKAFRPMWPMVVLRSPKGWTAPRKVEGNYLEGFWRAHQIPLTKVLTDSEQLKQLETWMRGYEPEKLFTKEGKLISELRDLAPKGNKRMSANPITNGGLLRRPLKLQKFQDYALKVDKPGVTSGPSMNHFAEFLRDIVRDNQTTFRVMGPDETESNKLGAIYSAGKKVWMGGYLPEDEDGGNLAPNGRVMEMLSEVGEVCMSFRYTTLTIDSTRSKAGSKATSSAAATACSTATNPSSTSSTQWSTSTQNGSRSASKSHGGRPSPPSTSSSPAPSGDKVRTLKPPSQPCTNIPQTTTASRTKTQASWTLSSTNPPKSSASTSHPTATASSPR